MVTAITTAQRVAAALAAALAVVTAVACSAESNGGPRASGDVVEGVAGDVVLPVTATYGYLDITVADLEVSDQPPEGVGAGEGSATYVAVEVSVDNPTDEAGFQLPPGMFSLAAGGDQQRAVTEDGGNLEVAPESSTTETLWFGMPEGTAIIDPSLEVNESGYEPLPISLAGEAAPPQDVPITMDGSYDWECAQVELGDAVASFNSPVGEDGTSRPGPDVSGLGRAPEGTVLVTVDVDATQKCPAGYSQYSLYGGYGLIENIAVGSQGVARHTDLGLVNTEGTHSGYLAMAVPADATQPLVLEWREWWTDGNENIFATTRAELDGIGALSGG